MTELRPAGAKIQKRQEPYTRTERTQLVLVWVGFAALLAWFVFRMIRGAVNTDTGDFNDFFNAAEAIGLGANPYESGRGGYLYPPLIAWMLQPVTWLGLVNGALAWGATNVALTLVCLWLSVRVAAKALRGRCDPLTVGAVWLAALALTFGPVRAEFEHGQTDAVILLGLCLGLVMVDRFPLLAGFFLGMALLVKHHIIVFLAYLLVRRRWKTSLGMLVGGVVFAFIPAVQIGLGTTTSYLGRAYGYVFHLFQGEGAIDGVNLHPITWDVSISISSAMARFFDGQGGVSMTPVAALTGLTAAAVFGATWWVYRAFGVPMFAGRSPKADRDRLVVTLLEWCGVIIGLLAFSPQTITRHTYIIIPAHVLAAYVVLAKRPGVRKWPIIAGVIGFQLAARLPPGEDAFREALVAWRHVSGATWFMLFMWIGLVWSTLSFAEHAPDRTPPPAPPEA